ncbi:hypothetical protein L345_00748, partial [Ophiophagus hannah]
MLGGSGSQRWFYNGFTPVTELHLYRGSGLNKPGFYFTVSEQLYFCVGQSHEGHSNDMKYSEGCAWESMGKVASYNSMMPELLAKIKAMSNYSGLKTGTCMKNNMEIPLDTDEVADGKHVMNYCYHIFTGTDYMLWEQLKHFRIKLYLLRNGGKKAFVAKEQGQLRGKTLIFKEEKNSNHLQGEELSIHGLKLLRLEEMKMVELKSNRNLGEEDKAGQAQTIKILGVNSGDGIDYSQQKRENIGDLIQETLEAFERYGGMTDLANELAACEGDLVPKTKLCQQIAAELDKILDDSSLRNWLFGQQKLTPRAYRKDMWNLGRKGQETKNKIACILMEMSTFHFPKMHLVLRQEFFHVSSCDEGDLEVKSNLLRANCLTFMLRTAIEDIMGSWIHADTIINSHQEPDTGFIREVSMVYQEGDVMKCVIYWEAKYDEATRNRFSDNIDVRIIFKDNLDIIENNKEMPGCCKRHTIYNEDES